jgi:2-polyprenyl-6-methoxyphenol hydroxylase-like FAD-dependent oxidoreductase
MRALVVGGGIGGLTTAIALRRVGIDALVLEAAEDVAHAKVGTGLHLWPNAMLPLHHAGIGDDLVAAGSIMRRGQFQSWRGPLLTDWPFEEMMRLLGVPGLGIARNELHGVLASALDPASIRCSSRVVGFEQDAEGVTVKLEDGSDARGDLLIGADGSRSTIRRQLLGERRGTYAGYVIWRTIIDFDDEDVVPNGLFRIIWGRGHRFLYFHVRPGRLYWSHVACAPEGGGDSPKGRKTGIAERHAGWPEPIGRIIAATDDEQIGRSDNYEYEPMEWWTQGRVTLLGDAAHPTTFNLGQGACQAIEDAFAVAEELAKDGDVQAALARYETRRRKYTAGLMKESRRIGELAMWSNPIAVRLREQLQKHVVSRQLAKAAMTMPAVPPAGAAAPSAPA